MQPFVLELAQTVHSPSSKGRLDFPSFGWGRSTNMKIKLEGLETLLDAVNTERVSKDLAFGIAQYTNDILGTLRKAVVDTYSISDTEFRSVTVSKAHSLVKLGKGVIQSGIEIKNKPKPLSTYPNYEVDTMVRSSFLMQRKAGYNVIKKRAAKKVYVSVRRGKPKLVQGGYKQKGGTSKWARIQSDRGKVSTFKTGIYKRTGETWIDNPALRAKVDLLFGPSVAVLAEQMLTQNKEVIRKIYNIDRKVGSYIKGWK